MIIIQSKDGKIWEERIITRILKQIIYVPLGTLNADKIRAVNKRDLIRHIEAEGYGK